jgi:hypothetical protein
MFCVFYLTKRYFRGSRDPDADEPLPKKSYGVLKDKQLRELLQEYDLPTQGDRNTMIARHSQYVKCVTCQSMSQRPFFQMGYPLQCQSR